MFDACLEHGLTAPDWPVELGGAGLTGSETRVFYDVLKSLRAPNPLSGSGKAMLGPLILELGTEDQKKRHILRLLFAVRCVGVGVIRNRCGLRSGGSANPGGRPW